MQDLWKKPTGGRQQVKNTKAMNQRKSCRICLESCMQHEGRLQNAESNPCRFKKPRLLGQVSRKSSANSRVHVPTYRTFCRNHYYGSGSRSNVYPMQCYCGTLDNSERWEMGGIAQVMVGSKTMATGPESMDP